MTDIMRLGLASSLVVLLVACAPIPLEQPDPAAGQSDLQFDLTPMERGAAFRVPVFHSQAATFRQETVRFELEPFEGMEYKYRLEPGESFLYSWQSTAPVHVEMHSQADTYPPFGYADSYELADALSASDGSYTAPYPGIHGWYWENRSIDIVTVTVTSAGFYRESLEFRAGQPPTVRAIE